MRNKLAAELRAKFERRVREAANKKNNLINQAKSDYEAELKAIRRELYDGKET